MAIQHITASGTPYQFGLEIGKSVKETVQAIAIHNEEFTAAEQKWLGTDYIAQMCPIEEIPAPDPLPRCLTCHECPLHSSKKGRAGPSRARKSHDALSPCAVWLSL